MELTKIRVEISKRMHECILNIGDEDIYAEWITKGIPDCPTKDDFEYIAENEKLFIDISMLFMELRKEG